MKKKPQKKRFQEKVDSQPDKDGLTGYNKLFLAHQERGPYFTDEELHEALGLDFFTAAQLNGWRKEFRDSFDASELPMLDRMEKAIRTYAHSATEANEGLLSLKLSILSADESLKRSIESPEGKLLALEVHRDVLRSRLGQPPVFSADFLEKYRATTQMVVGGALEEWTNHIRRVDPELYHEMDDTPIFRGIFNLDYYMNTPAKPDFLSLYAEVEETVTDFYEPEILNSNTLSSNVAEKFSTIHDNQRRALVEGTYGHFRRRLFSSFITSPSFKENQFELLTVAAPEQNLIRVDKLDGEFGIFRME
jgi:hypothetical protein